MNLILEKVEIHLEKLLKHDWVTFNKLALKEQNQEWQQLKQNFERIISKEYSKDGFDYKKVYSLINTYDSKFSDLPIEGKLYIQVNKRLLCGQLIQLIQDLEYKQIIEIENPACECQILSRFRKQPNINNLTQIGIINDHYYMPKLYSCNKCNFKWVSYITEDSVGETIFEKHNTSH